MARKRDTAARLIDVAERLCVRHGIEAVSIRDVAAAAKVSIPVIYHHFGSRAGLLRAIVVSRYEELGAAFGPLLAAAEAQPSPTLRDVLRIVLEPVSAWRRPGREATLQFQALALVCPLPEIKDVIDAGVIGFRRVVALLRRVRPDLTEVELCWRLHFCLKLTHQTASDVERLAILSGGRCRAGDVDEALERMLDFAENAFAAPAYRRRTRRRP